MQSNGFKFVSSYPRAAKVLMDKYESLGKRQALYKNCTPPWKDTYRKRCQERLKKSREKFVAQFRSATPGEGSASIVESLMQEEWKKLCSEEDKQLDTNDSIDENIAIFEEIRAELIREEQMILAEYEAGLNHEHAALQSSLQSYHDDVVICPICERNPLFLNNGVLFCSCGMKIETEQDCVSLSYVKHNLEEGIRIHNDSCTSKPQYGVVSHEAFKNLIMTCEDCDFMFIIV